MPARVRRDPADDWEQLRLLVGSPEQEAYEILRPIVLFGQPTAERAQETGTAERTLRRAVARFETAGMRSLFDPEPPPSADRRRLPAGIRAAIVGLKAEYPLFGPFEEEGVVPPPACYCLPGDADRLGRFAVVLAGDQALDRVELRHAHVFVSGFVVFCHPSHTPPPGIPLRNGPRFPSPAGTERAGPPRAG